MDYIVNPIPVEQLIDGYVTASATPVHVCPPWNCGCIMQVVIAEPLPTAMPDPYG